MIVLKIIIVMLVISAGLTVSSLCILSGEGSEIERKNEWDK